MGQTHPSSLRPVELRVTNVLATHLGVGSGRQGKKGLSKVTHALDAYFSLTEVAKRNHFGTASGMMNLTLKNIPETLYVRLKEIAARNRRSLNSEVIHRLEVSFGSAPIDADELLARARAVRERAKLPYLTEEALRAARDEGRA